MIVQWGMTLAEPFLVTNGVRKAGILSPLLFKVYVDDLSIGLTNMKIGCNFNGHFINHLVYADDTVLIASSPSALQKLIDFCTSYAENNDLVINRKKSVCMCVRPKAMKD